MQLPPTLTWRKEKEGESDWYKLKQESQEKMQNGIEREPRLQSPECES
jgi:hypothetical protein